MSLYVDIEKALGSFRLNAQFETQDNVLALLGASGCGKSVTLKCIAGIEKPDRGRIVLDGVTLFDSEKRINLPPQRRKEQELRELIKHFGKTVLLVSHNRDEVFRLADRIAILLGGSIETQGEKKTVFQNPQTKNSAILLGCKNISQLKRLAARRGRYYC